MKKSIIYIISNIDKALAFEWIATSLDNDKFKLSFILLNPGPSVLEKFLLENKISVSRITYNGKKDFPQALLKVIKLLKKEKPQVIHCHLFDASMVGLVAGRIIRVKKNIFTRHHSTLHHVYFPRAVYYDKLINTLATDIVAISGKVKDILVQQENVIPAKVTLIPHGFKLDEFYQVEPHRSQALRERYNPKSLRPVIGAIARYTHWKGLQYTIRAFKKLLPEYPNALLILANANGDYKVAIQELLLGIPKSNYQEIVFEPDVMALYQLFDVFVHVPIDDHSEAFGQTYIEALAAGIPAVFTLSGVANEFIRHKENAYVVPYQDADAIYAGMLELIRNKELRNNIISQGRRDVAAQFNLPVMIGALEALYNA